MSTYTGYTPEVTISDIENWATRVGHGVDMSIVGLAGTEQQNEFAHLLHNAHEVTTHTITHYIDQHISGINEWMNKNFKESIDRQIYLSGHITSLEREVKGLQNEVKGLRQLVESQKDLLGSYKAQLDRISADAGSGNVRQPKVPEPPTFSGSDNKMNLEEWLNQIVLYCSASGVVTDHHKVVCALTRLRSPATTYMKSYFDKNRQGEDLGSWDEFVGELSAIYGRRDDKEGAKEEITQLWQNKALAAKDFIKYVEQYRTLARIVEYESQIHIDKLENVISTELRNSLLLFKLTNKLPTKWEEYLELLLSAYKALHPEKAKGSIFGNKGNGNGNGKDPNAMEIDLASKKGKGKEQHANSAERKSRYCHICAGKGNKTKAKTHNTEDCYDKPGNEGKRPAPKPSTSTPTQGNKGGQQPPKKSFKARLLELLQEDEDSDGAVTPAGTIHVNTASIEEIPDPTPAVKEATARVDEVQEGPSRPTGQIKKVNRRFHLDFPQGL